MSGVAKGQTQGGGHFHRWVLAANEDGDPLSHVGAADRTVHIFGTFSGGPTITLQGSNDPTLAAGSWATLHDLAGAEIVATGITIAMLAENPEFIRPILSGGDGSTAVNINILSKTGR